MMVIGVRLVCSASSLPPLSVPQPDGGTSSGVESEYLFDEDERSLEDTILALTKEMGLHRQVRDGTKYLVEELHKVQGKGM